MINDSQEDRRGREAEFQTPQQPDPVSIPPKMKPSQLLDSPSKLRALDDLPVKSSQKIDSPSAMKPRTSRGGVDEFGSKSTPSGVHDGQDLRKNHSGPAMHDPASMHTRLTHPDQYKPAPDTRLNPSGPRLKLSSERRAEREEARLKAGKGFGDGGEPVTRGDFERMFWMMFPERLRGLAYERFGDGDLPAVGSVAVMGDENYAKWGRGFDFRISGRVYVAGVDMTPVFSAAEKAAPDVWIKVYFNGATPVSVHTSYPGAMSDNYEIYRIVSDGISVQNSDIHESRT